jgi:hypothetical protein
MKLFHIGDVLSVTTLKLVSPDRMDGVIRILEFICGQTGLYTHALPRVSDECEPWLRVQFPHLYRSNPLMEGLLSGLESNLQTTDDAAATCARWVLTVREAFNLPEMIPVYEMGADIHTRIDPVEELRAMVGDDKVIVPGEE